MTDTLKPLIDLQQVDLTADRLKERKQRLPELTELAELERRMGEIRGAIGLVERDVDAAIKEMYRLENDLTAIEDKITREEAKLYGGEVSNPKELSALQAEIEMLKRRKGPVEEQVLEQMIARDEGLAEKGRLEAELSDIGKEADGLRDKIGQATRDIDARLAEELGRRNSLLPQIPDDVVELYSSLREQKKGVGAGALEAGICSACHEALSAIELDRIKTAARNGEINFRCEHCRRILVVR